MNHPILAAELLEWSQKLRAIVTTDSAGPTKQVEPAGTNADDGGGGGRS